MDRLKMGYKIISGVYDRIIVSDRRSGRFYRDLIWGNVNEVEIITGLLEEIPESFRNCSGVETGRKIYSMQLCAWGAHCQ